MTYLAHIRVEDGGDEAHAGWLTWIVITDLKICEECAALVWGAWSTLHHHFPERHVAFANIYVDEVVLIRDGVLYLI